ncbi:hypothetical protein BC835DRAFT_1325929 [Cytidiella melzeri]|nr:hypothetical protein BC835DRAFT_1325929 [Cytidiella melzeri]
MGTLGYSSFFASGLLAPDVDVLPSSRPHTPDPTTPRSRPSNLDDTTPTASTHTIPLLKQTVDTSLPVLAQANEVNNSPSSQERPRMRRRRSSLGLNASSVTPLKSSTVQRQTMMGAISPARSRSGSVVEAGLRLSRAAMTIVNNDATSGNSVMGRPRSGSVGTALRPRRLRKQGTLPAPLPPPPELPLPDVPTPRPHLTLERPQIPCRPSAWRSQTSDAFPLPMLTPTLSTPSEDFSPMDVERNYALETPGEVRGTYF